MKMAVWLGILLASLSAHARKALECKFTHQGHVISLQFTGSKQGVLLAKLRKVQVRCALDIVSVDDLREGPSPAVEVKFRRPSDCHPGDAGFEKSLTREGTLRISAFTEEREGSAHLFAGKGYDDCRLTGYSAELLGLR